MANWASMTLYLRTPLDLTALPLNGPRVPGAGWSADDLTDGFWQQVATQVSRLQPGAQEVVDGSAVNYTKLPLAAFKAWRGNVIRIDESAGLVADDDTLNALGLAEENAPATDAADRLVWFFTQIARFGSPLILSRVHWVRPEIVRSEVPDLDRRHPGTLEVDLLIFCAVHP